MAYIKTTWVNKLVETPKTFNFQQNADATVTLIPAEGIVTEAGTPLTAAVMNKIEGGIEEVATSLADMLPQTIPHLGTTTNVGNAYSVTTTEIITTNKKITVKINATSTGIATLNVSSIGSAKGIKKAGGLDATLKIGVYTLFYDGINFQLLGEGGDYGTAIASDVLSGKTIGTDEGILNGTMIDRGTDNFTPKTYNQAVLGGKHSGNGIVYGDADLISANIKKDVVLFDTVGTYDPSYTAGTLPMVTKRNKTLNSIISTSWQPILGWKILNSGRLRFYFNLVTGSINCTCYGQIYVNGVPYGSALTISADNTTDTHYEDIDVLVNDEVVLYCKVSTIQWTVYLTANEVYLASASASVVNLY